MVLAVLALAWVVFTQLRIDSETDLLRQLRLVIGQTREQTDAFIRFSLWKRRRSGR